MNCVAAPPPPAPPMLLFVSTCDYGGGLFSVDVVLCPSMTAALRCGADLVVQSAHKTLGSLTQSAFLHLGQGKLVVGVLIGSLLFHPLELRPPANSKVDAVHMQSDRLVEKFPPC